MNYLIELIELSKSTVFQTVIAGVLVFVVSEFVQNFILKPTQEYKKTITKINNELKFYSDIILNPGQWTNKKELEEYKNCSRRLRLLSCDLEVSRRQLLFRFKQKDKNIADAASLLIGLSNGLGKNIPGMKNGFSRNYEYLKKIKLLLNIQRLKGTL